MSSSKIKKALKDRNLAKAFQLLQSRVDNIGNYDLKNTLADVQTTYCTMLTYMLNGYVDNDATTRRDEIIRSLFSINDQADRLERLNTSDKQSRYFSAYKLVAQKTSLYNIQQRLEVDLSAEDHEDEVCNLFNFVWTSGVWTKGEYETATSIINSEQITIDDKAVFISAVTLSLMETFDVKKIHLLFDSYLHPEAIINQRALVGIVLIIRMYDSRLECFPEIQSRIDIYADDPRMVSETFSTLQMLQYSSITDKIASKMQNDIFPLLMQKHNEITKMSKQEMMDILTENGENPEWALDKKIQKGISEMSKLQLEGADIYMGTFRYMKGYSFFNKIPHWFYNFNLKNSILGEASNIKKNNIGSFMKLVLNNSLFCSSDLYSFFFMMNAISGAEKELIESQVISQIEEEELNSLVNDSSKRTQSNKDIRRTYIFDLYRFFTLYPFYNQFDNPFKMRRKNADGTDKVVTFSPLETASFHFLLNEREEMTNLAEFFMRKGFYEEALAMYSVINPQEIEEDANLWQKIGFCKQKLGKEKGAYKTYLLADSLLPDSKWTMTHIAQLAQSLEIYDTARNYYDMLLMQDGDNLKFIVNKAFCQMKLAEYKDAITTLFKANYLDEESVDIRAMMAECYVMSGNIEKANDMILTFIANEKCPIQMRILNAFLAFNKKPMDTVYNYIRESLFIYKESTDDVHPFAYHYYSTLNKYIDYLDIDKNTAQMIFDSVNLEIR